MSRIIFEGDLQPLSDSGQIKTGAVVSLLYRGREQLYTVEDVLNPSCEINEEILLSKDENLYFITCMAISGDSWAKDVKFSNPNQHWSILDMAKAIRHEKSLNLACADSQRYAALKSLIDSGKIEILGRNEYEGDDCDTAESIPSDLLDIVIDGTLEDG